MMTVMNTIHLFFNTNTQRKTHYSSGKSKGSFLKLSFLIYLSKRSCDTSKAEQSDLAFKLITGKNTFCKITYLDFPDTSGNTT